MTHWRVATGNAEAERAFASLEAVFALEGEPITRDPLSEVIRVTLGGQRFYVKRYWGGGKGLRRYLGRPRVKAEWQNLQHFAHWGIAVAPVVAWGMERCLGIFRRGAMITLEVPDTTDLAEIASRRDERLSDLAWVRHVSQQLARATRILHGHNFVHNDLKWRNLLVNGAGALFLIDCPSGGFWYGPFLRHRIVKDLACLDKVAKYRLSRTQRLRFYLDYCERQRLSGADKALIRKVLMYFEGERMRDFVAPEDAPLLHQQGLDSFDALWNLALVPVDEPNVRGDGISTVYRLCIGERSYFLKRQTNYLTRTLHHPLKGEATLAREFRNIQLYRRRGIPTLHAAFFGERNVRGERQAMLLTAALDGWQDLHHYLLDWPTLAEDERGSIIEACGRLLRTLHAQGQKHSCIYPKHIFLKVGDTGMQACLIDLEKTRPLLPIRLERVADIETLVRRAEAWDDACVRQLLASYLDVAESDNRIDDWLIHLARRQADKGNR